jgi:hypothetical protein
MTSITVTGMPAAVRAPRGAEWAARVAAAAWRLLSQRRAARDQSSEPQSARDVARAAAAVRVMARQYAATDPGFAADLLAAADRHEAAAAR